MSSRQSKFHKYAQAFKAAEREMNIKECFIHNCSNAPIKAHTLQKNGALKYIAENNKTSEEVYYLDGKIEPDFENFRMVINQANNRIECKSISSASTFDGFCHQHDNVFNQELENKTYDGSDRMSFYYSFRTFAYALRKEFESLKFIQDKMLAELNGLPKETNIIKLKVETLLPILDTLPMDNVVTEEQFLLLKQDFKNLQESDFTNDKFKKAQVNNVLAGLFTKDAITGQDVKNYFQKALDALNTSPVTELESVVEKLSKTVLEAITDNKHTSAKLNQFFQNKTFTDLTYFSYSINGIFPLAGAFVAGYLDHLIRAFDNSYVVMPQYAITFFPEPKKNKTFFIWGTFKDNPSADIFYKQLNIKSEQEFKEFMSNLILLRGQNIFFSPRLWQKLPPDARETILKRRELRKDTDFGLYDLGLNLFDPKLADN